MNELLRFCGMNNSDYAVIDIPDRDLAVLVGLDEDYSSRYYSNMDPLNSLIDDLFDLEIDEIMYIDETLKQSIIEELKDQLDIDRLRQFINLCKEVAWNGIQPKWKKGKAWIKKRI